MKQAMTVLVIVAIASVVLADEKPKSTPVNEPELRDELLRRNGPDQEVRKAIMRWTSEHGTNGVVDTATLSLEERADYEKLMAKMKEVDSENMIWLKGVVEKHGWPTITLVGEDGAGAAWLLVQHADRDKTFQRRCLDLMTALPKGEVSQSNFAYLTDRVLLAEGKMQVYGTQVRFVEGKLKPRPLEDEANVDMRRSEVGLPPLAEYLKAAEQFIGGTPDAK